MSKTNAIFNKVPVKVPNRSGFDLSHENLFTATVGTLIPASVEEVLPGDTYSMGASMSIELPPLATNFKGRVDAKLETFFVPSRILWAGWQDFITRSSETDYDASYPPGYSIPSGVPQVTITKADAGPGSLADYLGYKLISGSTIVTTYVNALPFLAYKKVVDDWYKDTNVQKPFFYNGISTLTAGKYYAAGSPFIRNSGTLAIHDPANPTADTRMTGNDGTSLLALNQRNFSKDYFTTMTTAPQAGAAASLKFTTSPPDDADDGDLDTYFPTEGSFTIASLRAAESLQKWLERNNIAGTRYYDQILAHFGVLPADATVNRAVLLGSVTAPVIVNTVMQNAQISANQQTSNPYGKTTGAKFGNGVGFDKGSLVDNFNVTEHGFIITLFSLVPHAYYGTGARRYLLRYGNADYAWPEFSNIGDQEVWERELNTDASQFDVAGYNQRYAEYKHHPDEIHGLLRDYENLSAFALQRNFSGSTQVSDSLLQIPTNYMDSVMVTTAGVSGFNCIADCYFDARVLRALPEYSLPSLCCDSEGGHKIYVPLRGRRM